MTLREAYLIISASDPAAVLHVDHVCGEVIAHDSAHCALDVSEQYTEEDAAKDTREALAAQIAASTGRARMKTIRLSASAISAINQRAKDAYDAYKRERPSAISAISAYKCEQAIEGRCRCRCKGKLHGAKRKSVPRDDLHAAAFYCPCCGARLRLSHRRERIRGNNNPKIFAALRALDPWRTESQLQRPKR